MCACIHTPTHTHTGMGVGEGVGGHYEGPPNNTIAPNSSQLNPELPVTFICIDFLEMPKRATLSRRGSCLSILKSHCCPVT